MPRPAPLVAPVREQRSATAHAGGASFLPAMTECDQAGLRRRLRAARRAVGAARSARRRDRDRRSARADSGCRARTRASRPTARWTARSILRSCCAARSRSAARSTARDHEPAPPAHALRALTGDRSMPRRSGNAPAGSTSYSCRSSASTTRQSPRHGRRLLRPAFCLPASPPRMAPAAAGRHRIRRQRVQSCPPRRA